VTSESCVKFITVFTLHDKSRDLLQISNLVMTMTSMRAPRGTKKVCSDNLKAMTKIKQGALLFTDIKGSSALW